MNWTITRQELVLFHARHKRMRIIYGHDSDDMLQNKENQPFIQYRQYAQKILAALQDIFAKFPDGSEITLKGSKSGDLGALEIDKPLIQKEKNVLLAYLVYWRMCLNYEGWGKGSTPDNIIIEFIEKISTSDPQIKIKTSFTEHDLDALLSTLPLSPYWDLWGVFSDRHKTKPTLLDRMKDCVSPVYAAQLKYYAKKYSENSCSRTLLGYPATIRACYTDSARDGLATVFVSERDYYDYCYHPEGEEKNLYRAYGLFYDRLTLSLSGEQSNKEEKNVFYIAYQIKTSLDRHHFWHISLRPDDPENASLEQLWAAWWPLHQQILDWPTLHTSLATELEQLDIAYAQGEIFTDIIDPENKRKDASFSPHESVCGHAYMLFPMSCVCYEDKVWAYQSYAINQSDAFEKAIKELKEHDDISDNEMLKAMLDKTIQLKELELGFIWKPEDGAKRGHRPVPKKAGGRKAKDTVCGSCQQYREYSKNNPGAGFSEDTKADDILFHNQCETGKDSLQRQRYRRLIGQQLYLAEQMNDANQTQRERTKRNREQAAERLRKLLIAKSWGPDILGQIKSDRWRETTLLDAREAPEFGDKKLTQAGAIADMLFFGDEPGLQRERLLVLMTGGLHLYLSGILELHPAKGYSHTMQAGDYTEHFIRNWGDDKPTVFLSGTHDAISNLIKVYADLGTCLNEINGLIDEWIIWLKDPQKIRATNKALLKKICAMNAYPAAKLNDLKKQCAEGIRPYVNGIFNCNAKEISSVKTHIGANNFRASLPAQVLLPKDLLTSLMVFVNRNKHDKTEPFYYRLFWLPLSKVEGWSEIVARNYLAIGYRFDGNKSTPPNTFVTIRNHLNGLGGRFFIVFKGDGNSVDWQIIENEKDEKGNDCHIYKSEEASKCWPDNSIVISKENLYDNKETIARVADEYALLFKDSCFNTVLLLTFDSHYIPESTL